MLFAHDTTCALQSAVALVNSAEPPDTLETVEDLEEFVAEHGYTGRFERSPRELAEVRALRPTLRELFVSERDESAARVNRMLAEARALPQLVRHAGYDWHLHAVDNDAPLAGRIAVEAAMAMVDVLRSNEASRLSVCLDSGCEGIVLDLSRNRSRRYCSTTCANRNAVAAYRSRRRSPG